MANRVLVRTVLMGAIAASVAWAGGCTGPDNQHATAQPAPDHSVACKFCYDEIVKMRKSYGHGPRKSLPKRDRVVEIARHACPDCKTEALFYDEDGTLKLKCARCAPDGVPCDRCLPPEAPDADTGL